MLRFFERFSAFLAILNGNAPFSPVLKAHPHQEKDLPKTNALASPFPGTGEVRCVGEEKYHRKHIGAAALRQQMTRNGKLGTGLTSNRPHHRRPEDKPRRQAMYNKYKYRSIVYGRWKESSQTAVINSIRVIRRIQKAKNF